ncbi:Mediator of RNA polymerase II transcription subunit 10 [Zalerion maritima]|uniref:Mediator of RNA polymerase II transcription subunit 10 n=1 Tax=Zalerion maritima TaxID=339359 RepID=A0AAD5RYE7_9PEZI|nr:Mediator of RNA polymerase II transcription subunit 10 [Zalerion maritima]
MAPRPQERYTHDDVERMIKDIISRLYHIMVQTSGYDTGGRPTKDVLANEIKALSSSLSQLTISVSPSPESLNQPPTSGSGPSSNPAPAMLPSIPRDLIEYIENSRNPDIYTREFVELARRWNQIMRGKLNAFSTFTDELADAITSAMPELAGDVQRILAATSSAPPGGGAESGPLRSTSGNANGNGIGNGTV